MFVILNITNNCSAWSFLFKEKFYIFYSVLYGNAVDGRFDFFFNLRQDGTHQNKNNKNNKKQSKSLYKSF